MKLPTATKWRFCDFNIPQRRVGVLGKRYKWLLKYISLPDHPCLTFEHATHVCSISDTGFVILLLKGYAAISSNRKKKKNDPIFLGPSSDVADVFSSWCEWLTTQQLV